MFTSLLRAMWQWCSGSARKRSLSRIPVEKLSAGSEMRIDLSSYSKPDMLKEAMDLSTTTLLGLMGSTDEPNFVIVYAETIAGNNLEFLFNLGVEEGSTSSSADKSPGTPPSSTTTTSGGSGSRSRKSDHLRIVK
jgi:hypothetical protein